MTRSAELSDTRTGGSDRLDRLRARLNDRWIALGVPLLLIYARVVEGMVVSEHQLTLVRLAGFDSAHPSGSQGPLVNLEHWDAQWYHSIASHGYVSGPDAAFYPGYPLVSALLHRVSFGAVSTNAALFIVSWGSLVGLALIFESFCRRMDINRNLSFVTLFVTLFGPGSCFLISWYPLSLFLLLSCVTFVYLAKGQEWTAAVVAGAATSLSPVAVALSIALAIRFLFRRGPATLTTRLAKSTLSVWGIVAYYAYCQVRYGSLLEPVRAQKDWYVKAIVPFTYLPTMVHSLFSEHFDRATFVSLGLNLLCEAVALALIVRLAVRLARREVTGDQRTFSVFTIASLVIPAATVVPYATTFRAEGFARLSGASVGFNVEAVRGMRGRATLTTFALLWFLLGLMGQILFSGGWFT